MALLDRAFVSHSKNGRKEKESLAATAKAAEGRDKGKSSGQSLKIICAQSTMQIPRLVNGAHFLTVNSMGVGIPSWAASLKHTEADSNHSATLWPKFVVAHEQSH